MQVHWVYMGVLLSTRRVAGKQVRVILGASRVASQHCCIDSLIRRRAAEAYVMASTSWRQSACFVQALLSKMGEWVKGGAVVPETSHRSSVGSWQIDLGRKLRRRLQGRHTRIMRAYDAHRVGIVVETGRCIGLGSRDRILLKCGEFHQRRHERSFRRGGRICGANG